MVYDLKVFGERNTSTNALTALIRKNSGTKIAPCDAKELQPGFGKRLGAARALRLPVSLQERMIDRVYRKYSPVQAWKHALTDFEDISDFSGVHVVFCVRHPASWMLGLYRHPYHIHGSTAPSLRDFLNRRWRTVQRERMQGKEITAIELYNAKMVGFRNFQSRLLTAGASYSVVKQEDFAMDQAAVFERLRSHLVEPTANFTPLKASTKETAKNADYYRDYYGQQRWRNEIDAASMTLINDQIDWQLVADIGYEPCNPMDGSA